MQNRIPSTQESNSKFNLNLLQGRIAQVVVQTVFEEFGYSICPYGYENYLSGLLPQMKSSDDPVVKKIRKSPDFFIYDSDLNKGCLAEVKSTAEDETSYDLKFNLPEIQAQWAESILVVYGCRSANIYCLPISEVQKSKGIDLKEEFKTLPQFFERINYDRYNAFMDEVRKTVGKFTY